MAAPAFASDHPGLRVVDEVATILGAGLATPDAFIGALAALRRGLDLQRCRLWLRSPDGVGFTALAAPGEPAELSGIVAPLPDVLTVGHTRDATPSGLQLRMPLVHEDTAVGVLDVLLPPGPGQSVAHDVVAVVAKILSPVIAATELSQDLASEIAVRTRELDAQRGFAAKIIDTLPVGLYVIDRSYRIRAWNRKRETGTQGVSREEALGREVFDILDRQPRELLQREFDSVFTTGEIKQVEMESSASGESRHYRITKIPMRMDDEYISHIITIGEDITEWHQAQQRLSQTEKLAALGQLAAGVMHEINNPLATILACSEALAPHDDNLPEARRQAIREYLKIIDTEVQRCRRIVDGLLDFARTKTAEKRDVDVNDVVEKTLFLLKYHERFKRLTVARDLKPGLPHLRADAERLIQSFMALMLNAMDAMNNRGVLTVRTSINPVRTDELMVEFVDTGAGIKQDDLSKIFEPFFTTKPQGRGTGLGLSICYGIIADHRGRIEVESQIGVGSTFKVYLPFG